MAIEFTCPQCKHVLKVDEKLAGKAAKCPKCAATLRIPAPRTQAASSASSSAVASSPALGSALSELTDSDFNRHSPFESVYTPPKPQPISHDVLRRAASKDGREPTKKSSGMPGVLIFYAILSLIQGIGCLGFTVLLLVAANVLGEAMEKIPLLAAGIVSGAVLYGFLSVVAFATSIGLLTKKLWGYAVANAAYTFYAITNIFYIVAARHDRNQMIGAAIGAVITVLFATYFFRNSCLNFYKIRSWKLPLISSAIGALVGLIVGGLALGLGTMAVKTIDA